MQRLLLDERLDELRELTESGVDPTVRHLSDQLAANGQLDGLRQHVLHGQDEVLNHRLHGLRVDADDGDHNAARARSRAKMHGCASPSMCRTSATSLIPGR
jgi:hypothetical protein